MSLAWMTALWAGTAVGQPVTVGLFVGSNQPGPGQTALQYAARDAERVAQVLEELGGMADAEHLTDPDAESLLAALERHARALATRREAGEQVVFVFYYSGHAKRRSLMLGETELPLTELRTRLEAMPSTVTVAVLDACQSGAISNVKGVQPAASFSYASTDTLRAEGLVVMASSTGSELSQESEEIGGSFFTHHLVTGLRGAADADRSGAVSLDEAYRYAYRNTLVTTAPTQVGSQHVTLETRLRGHGDMVLTRPTVGGAWLVLDGDATGRILVVRTDTGAVVAEVIREPGAAMSLALPAAAYRLIGRDDDGAYACDVAVGPAARAYASDAACVRLDATLGEATVKSAGRSWPVAHGIELGGGLVVSGSGDVYRAQLEQFGFVDVGAPSRSASGTVSLTGPVYRHVSWVVTISTLEYERLTRDFRTLASEAEASVDTLTWASGRVGFYPRFTHPVGRSLELTVQGGGGITFATDKLTLPSGAWRESHFDLHAAGAVGAQLRFETPGWRWGPYLRGEVIHAPALRTAHGDRHDVGGLSLNLGVRVTP